MRGAAMPLKLPGMSSGSDAKKCPAPGSITRRE